MKIIQLALFSCFLLSGCAQKLYPPTEPHANFIWGKQIIQMDVGPYVNAMPGAESPYIIIGMEFHVANSDTFQLWERELKITKIHIPGTPKKYTEIEALDHNEWLSNDVHRKDYNVLRVPDSILDRQFDLDVHFKDNHGKRYAVSFKSLYAGNVY